MFLTLLLLKSKTLLREGPVPKFRRFNQRNSKVSMYSFTSPMIRIFRPFFNFKHHFNIVFNYINGSSVREDTNYKLSLK